MKKILVITIVILLASFTVTTFAPSTMAVEHQAAFKTMLKNYFSPVIHGFGIGFTEENYITAKWHVIKLNILPKSQINSIIREAKHQNETDWGNVRERIRNVLSNESQTVRKGRIKIEGINYLLTNIEVSNETLSADIAEIPDYESCKQQNISAEECESNSEKVGEVSVTKRTKPGQEIPGEPKVWAGTLTYNDVEYTFVTFAYPR